ncbi:MAG TPA: hypothetical protein DEQ34_14445 [Balneolaceae bacterium]|nr:hypothetical protein [Balneolaceae bacterium]|tara:strand:+ start:12710 stop:12991 length:282 start_codon:yes stop_codon:yes gene_type:complete
MLFGLPWYAIIPIVAIVGGIYAGLREKEMKLEEKRLAHAKESNELRKMIMNLKGRIENLEAIIVEKDSEKKNITIDDIEIKDEGSSGKGRVRN